MEMLSKSRLGRGKTGIDLRAALAHKATTTAAATDMTFAELCRAYLASHYDGCDMQLRKWIDAFGERNAWSGVTSDELVLAGEAMIEDGYAPSTVNRNMSQIGSVYKWAQVKRRIAPRGFISPTRNLHRYEEHCRPVELTEVEITRLIDAAQSTRDRRFCALVRILAETGARRGEVLDRTWNDVDLSARTITVGKTKTGVPRVLFISPASVEFIERVWPAGKRAPGAMLFESKRALGKPNLFKKQWSRITQAIGRPELRMHDLRHHRAKCMIEAHVPITAAAQALGHSSMILFRRYGHLETAATRQAIEASWATA